jgi:hypothetical protein
MTHLEVWRVDPFSVIKRSDVFRYDGRRRARFVPVLGWDEFCESCGRRRFVLKPHALTFRTASAARRKLHRLGRELFARECRRADPLALFGEP